MTDEQLSTLVAMQNEYSQALKESKSLNQKHLDRRNSLKAAITYIRDTKEMLDAASRIEFLGDLDLVIDVDSNGAWYQEGDSTPHKTATDAWRATK